MSNELPPLLVMALVIVAAIGVLTGAFFLVEFALSVAVIAAVILGIGATILAVARRG